MSVNYAVRPEIAFAALLRAGAKVSEQEFATPNNFPIEMPNGQFVWVWLDNRRVHEFVRFGGNDESWMVDFCRQHGSNVISEYDQEYGRLHGN